MEVTLKILHYIAAGIIIFKTLFVFGGEADIDIDIIAEDGSCRKKDGGKSPACTAGTVTGDDGEEDDVEYDKDSCPKEDGCKWFPGSGDDAGIWTRFYDILFAGDNLTKWGKIFISLVAIALIVWNANVSNNAWLFSIILSVYIVISYGGLQRTYSNKVGKYIKADKTPDDTRERGCNFIVPQNSYYAAKFLELRVGYIFLIMLASIVICYRNIKGKCWSKDIFNTCISVFCPLIMVFGLLIISYMVTPGKEDLTAGLLGTDLVGGGTAMDYVLAFFRGTPIAASPTTDLGRDKWERTIGFPTLPDRMGTNTRKAVKAEDLGEGTDLVRLGAAASGAGGAASQKYISEPDRLTRVKQRVYMKFIIVIAIFGFLIYSSVQSEVKCGLDFDSVKKLLTKAPTYLIAIIVFSPFIIKNIIINETVIDYVNVSYSKYEGKDQVALLGGATNVNVGEISGSENAALTDFSLECMIDKMGGLEIYALLCLLCLLMYAAEDTGYKLNIVATCVIISLFVGNAMDQGGSGGASDSSSGCGSGPACSGNKTCSGDVCVCKTGWEGDECTTPTVEVITGKCMGNTDPAMNVTCSNSWEYNLGSEQPGSEESVCCAALKCTGNSDPTFDVSCSTGSLKANPGTVVRTTENGDTDCCE